MHEYAWILPTWLTVVLLCYMSNRVTACSFPWEDIQRKLANQAIHNLTTNQNNYYKNHALCIPSLCSHVHPNYRETGSGSYFRLVPICPWRWDTLLPKNRGWMDWRANLSRVEHWLTTSWGNTCQKMLLGKMTSNELPKASKSASKVSVLLILSAIHHHEDMQNNPGNKPKQTHQAVMAQPLTQALQPQKHPSLRKRSSPRKLSIKNNGHKIGTRCLEGSLPFCQICSRDIISGPPSLTSISVASDKASKSSLSKSPSKVALAAAASWRYMGDRPQHASGTTGLLCNPKSFPKPQKHLKWLISIYCIFSQVQSKMRKNA